MKPWITVTHSDPETSTLIATCVECSTPTDLTVSTNGLAAWRDGTHIQDALPDLTVDERELMISGMCGTCFDKFIPADEDD